MSAESTNKRDSGYQAFLKVKPIDPIAGDERLTAFPISRPGIWEYYKDAQRSFWAPDEIDFSKDRDDYENHPKMTDGIRRAIDYINAFFASLDKMVNINIVERFKKDFEIYEVDCFYDFQVAMENIHGETYSLQLDTIVKDKKKRQHLLDSVKTIPVIKKMAKWIEQCINSNASAGERLIRMACVEGIFFMGAFCIIYWLQDQGMMKGMGQANESIARDESLHTMIAMFLYTMLRQEHQISKAEIYGIFKDAVAIATEFVRDAIPVNLPEMNADLMTTYLECQADNLITLLDLPALYGSKNPFSYMEKLNLTNRTNFFERRVSEYSRAKSGDQVDFETVEDF